MFIWKEIICAKLCAFWIIICFKHFFYTCYIIIIIIFIYNITFFILFFYKSLIFNI